MKQVGICGIEYREQKYASQMSYSSLAWIGMMFLKLHNSIKALHFQNPKTYLDLILYIKVRYPRLITLLVLH